MVKGKYTLTVYTLNNDEINQENNLQINQQWK